MPAAQRTRSARASAIAKRLYAPAMPSQRIAAARAVVATMDVIEGGDGLTYLVRRCPVSGAVVQHIPVAPAALPLLAYLRGTN